MILALLSVSATYLHILIFIYIMDVYNNIYDTTI